ncbi:MAG: RecB family exonuclease, partial [Egibacteraceae bacterium]
MSISGGLGTSTSGPAISVASSSETSADHNPRRLQLSFSRVDTYQTCPLKYRYSYVEKLPSAPSPQLSWGSSIHAALETWWSQKLPEPPPVDALLQALYDHWDDAGFEGTSRDEKLKWYRYAQDVLRAHHARFAPTYAPAVATEAWFELDMGDDIIVVGSIDHVQRTPSGGIGIVDWKTSRRAKTRKQVAGSLQLAIYAFAATELWGHEPEWVSLDFVVSGVRVTMPRSEIDTDAARQTIHNAAARIRAELFPAEPNRLCNWCDYRGVCPAFEGDGPDVAGLAVVELEKLRRRRERDDSRIAQLETLIRDRLGPT